MLERDPQCVARRRLTLARARQCADCRSHLVEAIGRDLGRWCGLDEAQSEAVAQYISTQSPERTQKGDAGSVKGLDELGWTAEQVDTFRVLCGPMMAAYGYAEDARYRLSPA